MYENVTLKREEELAIVTLNRPDRRNSLSDAMLGDLSAALAALRDDVTVRAIILTATPPVFSAGADAPRLKNAASEEERRQVFQSRKTQFRRLFGRVTSQLENLDQAVVCAINGHAVGGGWGLTLACDFRFAAENAQFWLPEVDLGAPLGVGTTVRMVRMAGEAWAKEIIMGCERYSAARVQSMGMLHRVCSPDTLQAEAMAYARKLAAKSLHVIAQTKANINAIARSGMAPVMAEPAGLLGWDQ